MDLDILILENLDDLLEESLEGQRSIGAVPDVYLSTSFNTGVLVIEPDLGIFSHLVQTFHEFGGNDDQVKSLHPFKGSNLNKNVF